MPPCCRAVDASAADPTPEKGELILLREDRPPIFAHHLTGGNCGGQ